MAADRKWRFVGWILVLLALDVGVLHAARA
jgi:hypothetical protein